MSKETYKITHVSSRIHPDYLALMSADDRIGLLLDYQSFGQMRYELTYNKDGKVLEAKYVPHYVIKS